MYFLKIDSLEAKPFCLKWKKRFNFPELRQNHSKDCLHWAITSKRNKLESSGWAQIIAYKKSFSDLMYFLKIESQEAKLFCLKGFKGHYQPALLHHWVQGSSAGRKSLSINIYGWILASVHYELAKTLQEGMILQFFGHSIMSTVCLTVHYSKQPRSNPDQMRFLARSCLSIVL